MVRYSTDDYATLLRTLAANAGDPQPVAADAGRLYTVAVSHGPLAHYTAKAVLRDALDDGHVLRWATAEGRVSYLLTGDGADAVGVDRPLYDDADRDALQAVIETEASRDDPDKDVIGWANKRLSAIGETDHE